MSEKKWKPMVGRLWPLKKSTETSKYPPIVLVVDESSKAACFFDPDGNKVELSKFFFRSEPYESEYFADEATITQTIVLLSDLLEAATNSTPLPKEEATKFSEKIMVISQRLRDIATKSLHKPIELE
jgi:hypothetical protein